MNPDSPTTELPKLGLKSEEKLKRLGIHTIRDLLWHIPATYHDFRKITPIAKVGPESDVTILASVRSFHSRQAFRRRLSIQEGLLFDDTGSIRTTWFNQPYLEKTIEKNKPYRFSGKIEMKRGHLQLSNPSFESADADKTHTGGLIPHYPLTEGITQKILRYWIRYALKNTGNIPDTLPDTLRQKMDLADLTSAIQNIHFPKTPTQLKKAQRRIAFDELLILQLRGQLIKRAQEKTQAYSVPFDPNTTRQVVEKIPFSLTPDQKRATFEILKDLEKPYQTHRLLEGDVGSGKTVCALIAAHSVAKHKLQSAFLAPTTILAEQHHETAASLLKTLGISVSLITSKKCSLNGELSTKTEALKAVRLGKVDIVIGTHAILQNNVSFKKLGLTIIDEQQRFGVKQRSSLLKARGSLAPHLLSMTATPIPRTLALTLYGELDISLIKTLPKGRKPIKTFVVPRKKRRDALAFIEKELKKGRQAYVIFPLIEESKKLQAKAATQEHKNLQKVFSDWNVGLLHGRLKKGKKEAIMQDFQEHKLDVLVSTSVVEVGVDVPNATIMMIENAERFGLAQLHQFRGRVGRSHHQSFCLLFSEAKGSANERLKALEKTQDGFELAEKDLEIRGPGEVYGETQSGFLQSLRVADLSNHKLLVTAQEVAQYILREDPSLNQYRELSKSLDRFSASVHLE